MKKTLPFLIVVSLLIGIIATIATSRVNTSKDQILGQNCGSSYDGQTGLHTLLKPCTLLTYGWPVTYVTSGVAVNLNDYHTVDPNSPANITNTIGYTSISRFRFLTDWGVWTVATWVLITASIVTMTKSTPKQKPSRRKK